MKKLLSILLIAVFLLQYISAFSEAENIPAGQFPEAGFSGMEDPNLVRYTEDVVYDTLVTELNSEEYFVENVSAVYISKEYLEEVEYNSQENIYFGYKLSDILECFQGTKYVFTLGDNEQTIVTEFEEYVDTTYEQILRNVAIGTGVILVCVTVSVVSAGVGAPAISMIFAASAKTGTVMALSNGLIGGVSAGIVKGIETGNMEQALKAAELAGSEHFMWGSISGVITGGTVETIALKGATMSGLTMNEAALIQKESGYPVELIKQFRNYKEYLVYKDAGLTKQIVAGKTALVQKINLDLVDESGRTNLQRMQEGLAALDLDGTPFELHHIGQKSKASLAMLSQKQHDSKGLHIQQLSEIDRAKFNKQKKEFWRSLAKIYEMM
ncbi:MAG: HNH/ENDO VII family nuclease [Clostridia bacterium]|nr:HNH/ENDO VII family nuclease [Clostridia bacterium]